MAQGFVLKVEDEDGNETGEKFSMGMCMEVAGLESMEVGEKAPEVENKNK